MSLTEKLNSIVNKHAELEKRLLDPSALGNDYARVSKEHSDMTPVVELINQLIKTRGESDDIAQMLNSDAMDKDMKDMMEQEKFDLDKKIPDIEKELQLSLLPKDAADEKNAILEVRAGTGGEEAALFAYRLFSMYQRYAVTNLSR